MNLGCGLQRVNALHVIAVDFKRLDEFGICWQRHFQLAIVKSWFEDATHESAHLASVTPAHSVLLENPTELVQVLRKASASKS